jgi:hypothetical protein
VKGYAPRSILDSVGAAYGFREQRQHGLADFRPRQRFLYHTLRHVFAMTVYLV